MSGSAPYLLDADAFICLRALKILDWLRLAAASQGTVVITEYVALHELSTLSADIDELKACGALRIEQVLRRQEHFRRLIQSGADKGEAEAVAWAITQNPGPVFISIDRAARRLARENKVRSGDIMDLLVDMIDLGIVAMNDVRERMYPWNDRRQQMGRPVDFTTFDDTFQRRLAARWSG